MFQILVAEDNKNTARLMKAVLKRAEYEVHEADNGLKALEITDKQHIDLIILDVMMPVMDGYGKRFAGRKVQRFYSRHRRLYD